MVVFRFITLCWLVGLVGLLLYWYLIVVVFDLLLFEFVACLFVDYFVLGFVCWWVCLLVW